MAERDSTADIANGETVVDPERAAAIARSTELQRSVRRHQAHESQSRIRTRELAARIDPRSAPTKRHERSDSDSEETCEPPSQVTVVPLDGKTIQHRFHGIDDDFGGLRLDQGQRAITIGGNCARFELGDPIGKGGQGLVFAVNDVDTRRNVALKCMRGRDHTPQHIARFVHEAQVTAQLEHPGVVPVHDLNMLPDGTLYYTMKRIEGQSLDLIIKAKHQHTTYELLQIFLRICQTMQFAHSRGVIHRDLKPANVMVGAYGEVLVVDWGLSKVIGETEVSSMRASSSSDLHSSYETIDGHAVGTPAYMSPEQATGDLNLVGPASDVYSLGIILYELLRGRSPYPSNESREVMRLCVDGAWLRLSARRDHIAPPLVSIVHKAMAIRQWERYPTAEALAADVDAYLGGRPVSVYSETLIERVLRNASRQRAAVQTGIWVAACACLAVLVSMALWHWLDRAELDALRRQAGSLVLQRQYDEARNIYERIVGRDPSDAVAQEALDQDLLRRQDLARERLQNEQVAEALAITVEAEQGLDEADMTQLEARVGKLNQALGRLPPNQEDELRIRILALRDRVIAALEAAQLLEARRQAKEQVVLVRRLLGDGKVREADRLLAAVEEILAGEEAVRQLRIEIDTAHREQEHRLRMRQVDDLLARAREAKAARRFDEAKGYLQTAVEFTPGDRESERLARLLAERDAVLVLQQQAEAARRQAEEEVAISQLRMAIDEAIAAEDIAAATTALQRIAELAIDREDLRRLETRVAETARSLRERQAETLLGQARGVLDTIVATQDQVEEQEREWRRLRSRYSDLDESQRRREFVLEQAIHEGEAAIASQTGQVISLLHQARSLAPDFAKVRAALADYHAWRVRVSERRGDSAAAVADAIDGQHYDDDQRYRLLFAGEGELRSAAGNPPLTVVALVDSRDRVLVEGEQRWQLTAEAPLILPQGRYLVTGDGAHRQAVAVGRGQQITVPLMEAPAVGDDAVYVPPGSVYDEYHNAWPVNGFVMTRHEITNGEWLEFLNAMAGRQVGEGLLLYPRDPDQPEDGLWVRRGNGRYQLRLRESGKEVDPQAPVTGISLADAKAYAAWRSSRDGLPWRLPTQAEWRLAAQGGDGRRFPWGDYPALQHCYSAFTHDPRRQEVAYPVGSFVNDRTVHGVEDMAGSVAEFVDGSWDGHPGFALYCGGSFADRDAQRFTSLSEGVIDVRQVHPRIGFRLVYVRQ